MEGRLRPHPPMHGKRVLFDSGAPLQPWQGVRPPEVSGNRAFIRAYLPRRFPILPGGQRQAAGLARQRRDHAEAAAGDRSPRVLLRARELEHPSRRAHARRARDRRLRGGAREGAALPQRRLAEGDRLRARRDRGHQPRRASLGPAQRRRGRRDRHHAGSSTTPTSCRGSSCAARERRASCASRRSTTRGQVHPRGVREAARPAHEASSRSRRCPTRSARSRRRAR